MKGLLAISTCLVLLGSPATVPLSAHPRQNARASLARGDAALLAGRYADASREYARVLEGDPRNGAAETGLLRALLKQDRVAEAVRQAERACAGAATDARLQVACADVYFRRGDFASAERLYAAAANANPQCARAEWGLGRIELIERRNRSARQHFIRAYELDSSDPNIVLDWAFTRSSPGERVAAAARSLALAANEDASTVAALRARIAILNALGDDATFVVDNPHRAYRLELRQALGPEGPLPAYRLPVLVNGQKLRLTLDTGTSGIYLNRKAAARSHLVPLAGGVPVRGVGDTAAPRSTFVAIADTVQVNDLTMRRCDIKVDSAAAFDDADGVIGTDVFSHFLVRLDFAERRIELLPPAEGEKSIAEDFWNVERQMRPGFTPVHVLGHLLLADARLNDVPGFLLVVDSGSPTHVLSTSAASRITSLSLSNASVRGVLGRVRETLRTGVVRLTFGALAQADRFLTVNLDEESRRQGIELGGVIGLDALREYDVTIDYTNGLLRLKRP